MNVLKIIRNWFSRSEEVSASEVPDLIDKINKLRESILDPDPELDPEKCLSASISNSVRSDARFWALLELLMDRDIFTMEEFDKYEIRETSYWDQLYAEQREDACSVLPDEEQG